MAEEGKEGARPGVMQDLPVDQLKTAGREFLQAVMVQALNKTSGRIQDLTKHLTDAAEGGGTGTKMAAAGAKKLAKGESPVKAGLSAGMTGAKETVKGAVGSRNGQGDKEEEEEGTTRRTNPKVTTIIEQFDVGLPRRVAYDQWTQFADYPDFTSKVESVEQESDEKINWTAKIFLSHRTWESSIVEQIPDERIVWKSKGPKGYVDGSVTFHELAPTMTRILLVAEYHPDGFVEKTANLWRAQGRRLRLDFKHIKRHMMMHTLLEQDELEGWRGEIREGKVVKTHEDALKEEQEQKGQAKEADTEESRDKESPEDQAGSEEQEQEQEREKAGSEDQAEEQTEEREKEMAGKAGR
jgi:uncharacterized membrane protein